MLAHPIRLLFPKGAPATGGAAYLMWQICCVAISQLVDGGEGLLDSVDLAPGGRVACNLRMT